MPVELFPCRISQGSGKGTKLGDAPSQYNAANTVYFIPIQHTVGVRQSVILTRKLYYEAFCQGTIMSFYSTMWLGVVRLGGMRLGCMRHFTTPPFFYNKSKILTKLVIVKYEKITFFDEFLVLLGPIICRFFPCLLRKK